MMFVGLFYEHYGQMEFVMPFVLLYAFEKAGPFLLSGFGRLKNPYKVWLGGNIITIFGCLMILLRYCSHDLWNIGAITIGLGLSCIAPSYRTVRDALREKNLANALITSIISASSSHRSEPSEDIASS